MSLVSEEYIRNIIRKVASVCNLEEFSYSKRNFESIAQNYFGVLIPVDLVGKTNGEDVSLSFPLVLKLAPTDERYRVSGALTLFFAREIFVYSKILEKYREYQQGYSQLQYVIPKCYYICKEYCNEVIVMQNMCSDGYRPYTEKRFLDIHHIGVALKSLAKLHALSFIMRERDIDLYKEAINTCLPLTEKSNKRFFEILLDRLRKGAHKFENTKYLPLFKTFGEKCGEYVESAATLVGDTCICHGDIWKENILYQYKVGQPISACLIDYQTARMASPAFDVLFLIITSTDTELRHKYYYKLLDVYYETFSETLKEARLQSQDFYSRQVFDKDLNIVASGCFIVANTALWLSSGLQEEGHVRSKIIWSSEEEKLKAEDNYKEIIKRIIDDFCSYKYLFI